MATSCFPIRQYYLTVWTLIGEDQLVKGQVTLLADMTVCNEGDVLTSEQARILKLLGHQHAEFKLNIVSGWNKEGGKFELFKEIEMRPVKQGGETNLGSGGEAEGDSEDNFEDDE